MIVSLAAALSLLALALGAAPVRAAAVGTEFQVNTYTTYSQNEPAVALDADGDFVVVWTSGLYASPYYDRCDSGQDDSDCSVFAQRYNSAGAPVGTEFRVNTYTTGSQRSPAVAMDAAGNFVVVWTSGPSYYDTGDYGQDGSYLGVFGQRYNSAGAPVGEEFPVNSETAGSQSAPAVASGVGGDFVVVWQSPYQDGDDYGVFVQRFDESGAVGVEFQVNTYTSDSQTDPAVAADADGNFVVVWQSEYQDDRNYLGVFAQRFDKEGVAAGSELQVNTYTTDSQRAPAVATDSAGNFIVVWQSWGQDTGGYGYGVFAQRFDREGVALGGELQVNTYTTDSQRAPAVGAAAAGNFVVAWASGSDVPYDDSGQDGSYFGVFGRRFDSAGAMGDEFQVNSYTGYSQREPAVAMEAAGNFVVVWESFYQEYDDSYYYGIFGKRFRSSASTTTTTTPPASTSSTTVTPAPSTTSTTVALTVPQSLDQLSATLPNVKTATGKAKKVAKKLAKFERKARKKIEKGLGATGKRQKKLYNKARKNLDKLLKTAVKAAQKARLGAPLGPIQAAVANLLERLDS